MYKMEELVIALNWPVLCLKCLDNSKVSIICFCADMDFVTRVSEQRSFK